MLNLNAKFVPHYFSDRLTSNESDPRSHRYHLSYHEQQTGKKMASQLQKLGFDVTNSVGGYGVVGIYRNGQGPTVMIRTDTDALPITEQTGKAYASTVTTINKQGSKVGVMHGKTKKQKTSPSFLTVMVSSPMAWAC